MLYKKDLVSCKQPLEIIKKLKDILYGNLAGNIKDEKMLYYILSIFACKLYDELYTAEDTPLSFYFSDNEPMNSQITRLNALYQAAKKIYREILINNPFLADDSVVTNIIELLQNYFFSNLKHNLFSTIYETVMPHNLKGNKGQFFTPINVVKAAVDILSPAPDSLILDPACGTGGFLLEAAKQINASSSKPVMNAYNRIFGIDKDSTLCKIAKANLLLNSGMNFNIFCEDSLDEPRNWADNTRQYIDFEKFDIVLTNPPFGSKIAVRGANKLSQYHLGHKWIKSKLDEWEKSSIKKSECPEILFIERCLDFLKANGSLAIILSDSILSNPTEGYIRQYLLRNTKLVCIMDLPMNTFMPFTAMKTHLLILKKQKYAERYNIQMSYPKSCGHDKRGRSIGTDEISMVSDALTDLSQKASNLSHLAYNISSSDIKGDILLPKYYDPQLKGCLTAYIEDGRYNIVTIMELKKNNIIKIVKGHEVGSQNYGTGDIPFIRTSEICNWEIAVDPTHCISDEIYNKYKSKQKIKEEDILIVNDGTYLIGKTAMITDLDTKMVYQSHFRKITVLDKAMLSPYLLLALLGLDVIQRQMESKAFRQGTISTLGDRLLEVKLPIPTDIFEKEYISNEIENIIRSKRNMKYAAQNFKIGSISESLMGKINKRLYGNI